MGTSFSKVFLGTLLTLAAAQAEVLGFFPASEIFVTQTTSPQSINVIHLKKGDNGILQTTILSRQTSFKDDFKRKFDELASKVTVAKVRGEVLEVDQQSSKYFWIRAHSPETPLKVNHKIAPIFSPIAGEHTTDEERASMAYNLPIVEAAWEQYQVQEAMRAKVEEMAKEVELREHNAKKQEKEEP